MNDWIKSQMTRVHHIVNCMYVCSTTIVCLAPLWPTLTITSANTSEKTIYLIRFLSFKFKYTRWADTKIMFCASNILQEQTNLTLLTNALPILNTFNLHFMSWETLGKRHICLSPNNKNCYCLVHTTILLTACGKMVREIGI